MPNISIRFCLMLACAALSFAAAASTLCAQQPQPAPTPNAFSPQLNDEMQRLQQAALQSDYAYRQVAYLTENIGARLSGSPQAARAVEYVAAELRKLGLAVRLEKTMVPHWVRGEERGALTAWTGMAQGTTQKIVLTALGGSVATPANGTTAEVVVVNNFDELRALGRAKVAGKIVLFNHKFDYRLAQQGYGEEAYGQAVGYRGIGASEAAKLGAVAALVRSVGGASYRLPHTGSLRYLDGADKIPAAAVAAEDADLIAHLAAQGRVQMNLVLTPQTLPDVESYNVIADVTGSEKPDEIVVVSGHLDSWDLGTGAIDDAAGVAAAMQVGYLCQQLKLKPKRTIRIIAWMNEENGLHGGTTYATNQKDAFAKHFAAIEMDLGAGHPVGILAGGKPELQAALAPISQVLDSQGAPLVRMVQGAGADIGPLERAGVPAFAPWMDTRTYFDYHHTPADTLDKIVPRELQENGAVLAVLSYGLASMDGALPR